MKPNNAERGFSLIEVMVAIFVISIALLGIIGIEGLVVSNTGVSKMRGVAAILAENMAAAMGANTSYWGSGSAPATTTVSSAVTATSASCNSSTYWMQTTLSDSTLNGYATDCSSSACTTTAYMAAYDLKNWGCQLSTKLPSGSGSVACSTTSPVVCTVSVSWNEKNLAYRQGSSASSTPTTQTYQMVVQP